MNPLELFDQIILDVITLKGPKLMLAGLIAIGYALKGVPFIPNRYIPWFVMVGGPVLAPFFLAWPDPGSMEPGLRFPDVAAWFQIGVMGFLMAGMSWGLHAKVLKPFIDNKLGGVSTTDVKTPAPLPPPLPTEVQSIIP